MDVEVFHGRCLLSLVCMVVPQLPYGYRRAGYGYLAASERGCADAVICFLALCEVSGERLSTAVAYRLAESYVLLPDLFSAM